MNVQLLDGAMRELQPPKHFEPSRVGDVWRVPYEDCASEAEAWADKHGLGPEVTEGPDGDRIGRKNTELIDKLHTFDAVVVAGQAKSHCMAWTIDDLLEDEAEGERLAERTYLLEDCTSPVVVPGVVDYTEAADGAFERYAAAGMHVVRSVDSIESWPGLAERET